MTTVVGRHVGELYDSIAGQYDTLFSGKVSRAEDLAVFAMIRATGCANGYIVDLGCGTGLLLEHIPKDPGSYLGIDVSAGMLRKAVSKFPRHVFAQRDMTRTGCYPGAIGSVVSVFGGFSYVPEPRTAIREMHRILMPNGRFFVMAFGPARVPEDGPIYDKFGNAILEHTYKAQELQELFSEEFRNVSVRGFGLHAKKIERWFENEHRLADVIRAESATLGRIAPDKFPYLIVTGRR